MSAWDIVVYAAPFVIGWVIGALIGVYLIERHNDHP